MAAKELGLRAGQDGRQKGGEAVQGIGVQVKGVHTYKGGGGGGSGEGGSISVGSSDCIYPC
jgi:hypothetical protein